MNENLLIKSRKLKILHIVSKLDTGGLENGVINICNMLDRTKFVPMICCINDFGVMAQRVNADVRVRKLDIKKGISIFNFLKMAIFLFRERPDIVHTHGIGQGSLLGIICARIVCIPVVVNGEHGRIYKSRYQIIIQRILCHLCDITLSVSNALKVKICESLRISPNKIVVIPNGVDTTLFTGAHNVLNLKTELRDSYDIILNDDDFVIGLIASLKPEKNQKLLLDAAVKIIKQAGENRIKILLVGDGPDKHMLNQYIYGNGLRTNVACLNERNDVYKIMSIINVLVLTSIGVHEGMSNVLLEAMSSGIPVITTKSTGSTELVKNGENGYILASDRCDDLAEIIMRLFNNRAITKRMGDNARCIILNQFSLTKMVLAYETLYLNYCGLN